MPSRHSKKMVARVAVRHCRPLWLSTHERVRGHSEPAGIQINLTPRRGCGVPIESAHKFGGRLAATGRRPRAQNDLLAERRMYGARPRAHSEPAICTELRPKCRSLAIQRCVATNSMPRSMAKWS